MESSVKPDQPVKRRRGRPPKHLGVNQYTGVRAMNVSYVRQYLRKFLEDETLRPPTERVISPTLMKFSHVRLMNYTAHYYRHVMSACRLLLACEGVYLTAQTHNPDKLGKFRDRLVTLGKGAEEGTIRMPDLLHEIDLIEKEAEAVNSTEEETDDDDEI